MYKHIQMHSETSVTGILLSNVFVLLGIVYSSVQQQSQKRVEKQATRIIQIQRKGLSQYSKAMSMDVVRTHLRSHVSSLEHLKFLLTLDGVSGNNSKRPELGETVAIPVRSADWIQSCLTETRYAADMSVQFSLHCWSNANAGAFILGIFLSWKNYSHNKDKKECLFAFVCVWMHATTETVRKIRCRISKCCPF